MRNIKRFLAGAAGPGSVAFVALALILVFDRLGAAAMMGTGMGAMANPYALVIAIVGMFAARRWRSAVAYALAAALASRLIGVSRLEPASAPREIFTVVSAFVIALIMIAAAAALRALITAAPKRRRSRASSETAGE